MTGPAAQAPLWRTIARGVRLKCPSCGQAPLYRSYLKLNQTCTHCGASFARAETADVAPYLTIFLVGLVATPLVFAVTIKFGLNSNLALAAVMLGVVASALVTLPRVKAVLASLLWRAGREI